MAFHLVEHVGLYRSTEDAGDCRENFAQRISVFLAVVSAVARPVRNILTSRSELAQWLGFIFKSVWFHFVTFAVYCPFCLSFLFALEVSAKRIGFPEQKPNKSQEMEVFFQTPLYQPENPNL